MKNNKYKLLYVFIYIVLILIPIKVSAMGIFVKTLTGQNIAIDVEPNVTINTIKLMLQEELNILPEQQKLLFAGKELEGEKTISDYNIQRDSTLHLVYTLELINVKYNIQNLIALTNNVTENGVLDDGSYIVSGMNDFTAKLQANEGYKLPTSITVNINGNIIEPEKYTYNSETGEILISKDIINGNIVIDAIAETTLYKVIFDANGGTFNNNQNTIEIADIINFKYNDFEKPTRNGYTFVGFYTEKTGGKSFDEVMNGEAGIEEDTTFYARWQANSTGAPGTAEPDEEVPNTLDKIEKTIFIGIISLIGLVGATIYLIKKNKVRAN